MNETTNNIDELKEVLKNSSVNDIVEDDVWQYLNDDEKKLLNRWVEIFKSVNLKNKSNEDVILPYISNKLQKALNRVAIKLRAEQLKQLKGAENGK